jgi:hypothetical protein
VDILPALPSLILLLIEIKVDEGDMFRQADSYALGILRNFNVAAQDLISKYDITYADDYQGKLTAGNFTRCQDRFEAS